MTFILEVHSVEHADVVVAERKKSGVQADAKVCRLHPGDRHASESASREELHWLFEQESHPASTKPLKIFLTQEENPHDLLVDFTDTRGRVRWFNEGHPLRGKLLKSNEPEQQPSGQEG